ncbi:FAS1-like dehydratase domain-containing protein [Primorskyibacter sp. S187A]|uniref:FAS1-like dehydratase domain-containing protein n=1 Tax=Primorskyibacter sp. S187A TaxID=3415130 RepID=UPI003C7A3CD5
MDQVNLQAWVGREEVIEGCVSARAVGDWLVTVSDGEADIPPEGAVAPQLAHWIAFNPQAPMAELAEDGHPRLGDFLPPVGLPRRMWAGGSLHFKQPLHVGERLTRRSRLHAIEEKTGRTSRMVFVTVDHEISGDNGVAITERQDIVYLPFPETFTPPKPVPAPERPDGETRFAISTPRLFRYSAVTFNAHRIHYDLPYAQGVEKLPGLVVHGPMQATALLHYAERFTGQTPSAFRFRSIHPMFHDDDLRLLALYETPNTLSLSTAAARGGHVGMQATASWEART